MPELQRFCSRFVPFLMCNAYVAALILLGLWIGGWVGILTVITVPVTGGLLLGATKGDAK